MRNTNLILLLIVLLTSCLKEKDKSVNNESTPKQIVLIFKDFPEPYSIKLNDTKGKAYTRANPELRYFDENLIQRTINPKIGTNDTIIVPCNRKSTEFQHSVKGIDNFDYVFQKGDTVIFEYNEKVPIVKVTNRNISDFETNYDLKYRELVCKNDYPALTKVIAPFMFITYNSFYTGKEGGRSGILGQIDKIKSDAQLQFKKEVDIERNLLDSLFDQSLLSDEGYKWLNRKLEIKILNEKAYNDNLNRNDIKLAISKEFDSLLTYHSYRNLVASISSTFYDRKVKRVLSLNSNLPDYKIVYDSIYNSNLFSLKTREILLFETSNVLIQNITATEIDTHLKKVKKEISDTSLISYLVDKYKLKNQLSNDLQLVDFKGTKTTLSKFIKEHNDKIVYVDIWASWCAPCIEEFPKSKILAERLKNKNIVFIYLSIDDETDKWNSASKKHNLPDKYSFLIENKNTSKFLEKLDFSSIPHYIIFNQNGELENINAPRPSDSRTYKLLDRLLLSRL